MQGFLQDGNLKLDLRCRGKCPVAQGGLYGGYPHSTQVVRVLTAAALPTFLMLQAGPGADLKQPGGRGRCHRVLVGRVDQVDGVHQDLWRGRQVPGAALPEAEVQPQLQGWDLQLAGGSFIQEVIAR